MYEEAIDYALAALSNDLISNKGAITTHKLLAMAYFKTGKNQEARESAQAGLDRNPEDKEDITNLATLLSQACSALGLPKEAKIAAQRAL